jgi:integrase
MSTIWTSINQRTLSQIEATGKVYFIRDNDLRGFGIKVTARGKATFIVEGRIKGSRTTRVSIGDVDLVGLREAKEEAYNKLYRMKKGEDLNFTLTVENSSHDSLHKHIEGYIDTKTNLAKGTRDGYRNVLNKFFKDWMAMPVEAISPALVQERRSKLMKEGLSEDYVNRGFRTLKVILNTADLPHQNPVSKFYKKFSLSLQSTNKQHFLKADDIVSLVFDLYHEKTHLPWHREKGEMLNDPPIVAFLWMLLLTGARKTEMLDLRWEDITDDTILIKETKNHREHLIPKVGMIKDVLEFVESVSRNREPTDRVFEMTYSKYRSAFEPWRTNMNFTAHDLRRTFAEHANLCGFDDNMIGMALNHKTVSFQRKTYMSGQLAKAHLMKEMFLTYQKQIAYYIHSLSQQKAPDDFDGWSKDVEKMMMSPDSSAFGDIVPFKNFLKEINPAKTEAAEVLKKAGYKP